MRLWSIHPQYLDQKGLVALWRESLLAQKVLQGRTKGYRHHPQLLRFKTARNPVSAIAQYLRVVSKEGARRGYKFDTTKIAQGTFRGQIPVTTGQLHYELMILKAKVKARDPQAYAELRHIDKPETHPLFSQVPGDIAGWEIR
jgi:hypothetical protein